MAKNDCIEGSMDPTKPRIVLPDICPVSEEWLDLTDKVANVASSIANLLMTDYSSYGCNFSRDNRPVNRDDFTDSRVDCLASLSHILIKSFGRENYKVFEQARMQMFRLADAYGMNETDLEHFEKLGQPFADRRIPIVPDKRNKKAIEQVKYTFYMIQMALFRHGELLSGVIAKNIFMSSYNLERDGTLDEKDLYPGELAENAQLRFLSDLVSTATIPLEKNGKMPLPVRISYHDQIFGKLIRDPILRPDQLAGRQPMSHYLGLVERFDVKNIPNPPHPKAYFPPPNQQQKR